MRRRKIEDIERLVRSAAAMCDLSQLDEVRRKLKSALRDLDLLSTAETKEKASDAHESRNVEFHNPKISIQAIDREIRSEMDKMRDNGKKELLEG